jgi:hypothetical protein
MRKVRLWIGECTESDALRVGESVRRCNHQKNKGVTAPVVELTVAVASRKGTHCLASRLDDNRHVTGGGVDERHVRSSSCKHPRPLPASEVPALLKERIKTSRFVIRFAATKITYV